VCESIISTIHIEKIIYKTYFNKKLEIKKLKLEIKNGNE